MAPKFARPSLSAAAKNIAATVCFVAAAAFLTPQPADAQRNNGSVTVDLTVLDALGNPRNIPQLLQPGVRSLMMPNARSSRSARPSLSQPRGGAAAARGGLMLKPPSKMKRAVAKSRRAAKAAPRTLVRKPAVQRPRPPSPPKIATRPPARPTVPAVPTPPKAASIPAPVPPPPAPSVTPPPAAPVVAPPPPAQKPVSRPVPEAPKQTASLPPAPKRSDGKLAAGQQFRLSFGAGAAAVQNAAAAQLNDVAKALQADDSLRLQLLAYSGGGSQTPSQARRLSLSRALAVRSHLIEKGVRSTRIDVRALGNKSEGGPPDRVDVIVTKR